MNIRIYQINMDRDKGRACFLNLDSMALHGMQIDPEAYDMVYEGPAQRSLEETYRKFNTVKGVKKMASGARSLSISDIVEVFGETNRKKEDEIEPGFYFCDSFGFKAVDFDPRKARDVFREASKEKYIRLVPGKEPDVVEIDPDHFLEEAYAIIGCRAIEVVTGLSVPYGRPDILLIVDEDGALKEEKRVNIFASKLSWNGVTLFGTALIGRTVHDTSGEADIGPLTDAQRKALLEALMGENEREAKA